MRVVLQRVAQASVSVSDKLIGKIGSGLLLLVGFQENESQNDFDWTIKKITQLRVFPDENNVMNLSVMDISGEILVVSQFTLFASVKKGNRPSYIRSAKPEMAIPYYEKFISELENKLGQKVVTGVFGADMGVQLINDGPVTIIIDSKQRDY